MPRTRAERASARREAAAASVGLWHQSAAAWPDLGGRGDGDGGMMNGMDAPSEPTLHAGTPVVAAAVPWAAEPVGGRILALPAGTDRAVVLEGPGPVLWRLLQSPTTPERIAERVRQDGDDGGLDHAELSAAVLAQLRTLEAAGLVVRA